ncbi:hypothetical protein PV02_12105 [Methanolobus chelungpuianus]|uniref:Uncharacterized protein n=1 Tax=Methanolobus chelungpuianus TaxID=502115 RepID=A0AAE3HBV1_9EURY|nr:hypothetical protein [Methanolobus chelungpuianus]
MQNYRSKGKTARVPDVDGLLKKEDCKQVLQVTGPVMLSHADAGNERLSMIVGFMIRECNRKSCNLQIN